MVSNSTNINKTNNNLSHQIIEHKKDHDFDNLGHGLGQAYTVYEMDQRHFPQILTKTQASSTYSRLIYI